MVFQKGIRIKTNKKVEEINISDLIEAVVFESKITTGIVSAFCGHTTASIYLNNIDKFLPKDIDAFLKELVPNKSSYLHNINGGGNTDAHIKALLVGNNINLPLIAGKCEFGNWQGIFFGEFDGPRQRSITVTIVGE